MTDLKNKVVIVTGASSGIGRSITTRFAQEGAKIVINYKSNTPGAEETAKQVHKHTSECLVVQGDVSDQKTVVQLFQQVVKKFGTVDILINNAGNPYNAYIETTDKEHWIKCFEDNFFSTVLCSKEALIYMQKNKSGKIINTASVNGIDNGGGPRVIAYSAAKAAVINFTKTLAKQVAPYITVNAVAPGVTLTPYYDRFTQDQIQEFIKKTPIGRMIDVNEIAEAFISIAKNDAMTGSIVLVDGGYMLK